MNGAPLSVGSLARHVVFEDDLLIGDMTVRETLETSIRLRRNCTKSKCAQVSQKKDEKREANNIGFFISSLLSFCSEIFSFFAIRSKVLQYTHKNIQHMKHHRQYFNL
jgi:hypothetical protein